MLENSSILITGGTGSFGKTFIPMTLKKYNPKRIVVFSRDEMKQWEMAKQYTNDNRIRFFIGDVRDKDRLWRALKDIDYVVHAAALKIVPKAEYDPFECIRTNVNGAMNLIDVAIDRGVKRVVALSTDKACSPSNLYGATKLISDKVFISSNSYSPTNSDTSFSIVRYGNVMGSRGSVIPLFLDKATENVFPITDKRMTRFMISLDEAVKLVWHAFLDMYGGEIYIKKIKSMKVIDIAKAINPSSKFNLIGIRPGEKLHENMIGVEDAPHTYEYETYYKILPAINNWSLDKKRINNGKLVSSDFTYSSNLNTDWMEIKELQNWIRNNMKTINTF
ncbi:UDP-N-acetylglucosamine 4,6-dehydratase (inverting) [Prochlorococcus marinus]|uniref:UDP-N-acetylglucosamine 4,6-dehydratase (inverting) n=1 Tax=Prochlorococcus marinus TaxID=1219 RepID=UPI001ADBF88D|nr:UDP-N-acetylglucosamine 4,6-dehydratase (inverting) [Prochlorococcus marinus]MBO8217658.1 UDP-N-acetylglucosamine 4,6-dehydratase (inverting) [Prochlorococcus marinus XMU1405]MBW3040820.1 UDP-N-acetylglucosamine 4,6-dehydratase (inverting) [Prochlorococcus marinus str. MU1405]MBW3048279.1 UDP-N-acetylglucosamine 4,6-dehydratase (inverting) [Prochlorococcus marinus str. MU1406]